MAEISYAPRPYQPSGLSRGMSHLSSVLDALLERQSREEMQRRTLEQQAKLAATDDARLQQQADEQFRHNVTQEDLARENAEREGRDKEATRALSAAPHVFSALASGDQAAAQTFGHLGGMDVSPAQAPQPSAHEEVSRLLAPPQAQAPEPQPTGQPAMPLPFDLLQAQMARFQPQPNPEDDPLANLPPVGQAPASPPPAPAPAPTGRYSITMPGQEPIEYDPMAGERLAMERGGRAAKDVAGLQSPSPFHAQALGEVQSRLRTGKLKPEKADEAYATRVHELEAEAAAKERARIAAAAKPEQPSGTVYDPTTGKPVANVPFKKDAGDVNKTAKDAVDFNKIVLQLRDSYAKGRVWPTSAEAQRRKALVAQAGLAIKNNEDLGALVGGDWKIINDQVGEGESWKYITDPTPSIDEALKASAAKLATYLGSKGLSPSLGGKMLGQPAAPAAKGGNKAKAKSLVDRALGGK